MEMLGAGKIQPKDKGFVLIWQKKDYHEKEKEYHIGHCQQKEDGAK